MYAISLSLIKRPGVGDNFGLHLFAYTASQQSKEEALLWVYGCG